jgi:hypothetical protein
VRYRLRTLLILLAVGPPVLGWLLGATVEGAAEVIERRLVSLSIFWVAGITTMIVWDWHRSRHRVI